MKHAELFAGYGGLSLAVEAIFGAELAWHSEFDAAPSRVMARHWPDVPNYGDATQINWSAVEPVDIISGGSPCQDVSAAGRRAGMNEGTRSNLWVAMRDAIATIQPTYVVWENVRGAHSASAYSEVESEPGLLADPGSPHLRATGRVAGDLAGLGYDAEWRTVSASSVGAPHRRERVFLLAWRRDAIAENSDGRRVGWWAATPGEGGRGGQDAAARVATGASSGTGAAEQVRTLPTPLASDHSDDVEALETRQRRGYGSHLRDLPVLLPTPKAGDGDFGLPRTSGRPPEMSTHLATRLHYTDFGTYAAAIHRWEQVLGRPSPPPTELSPRGKQRLSAAFCEWMMGLPEGWICDAPGITRRDAIKAAGNGVVPQQATAALRDMIDHIPQEAA